MFLFLLQNELYPNTPNPVAKDKQIKSATCPLQVYSRRKESLIQPMQGHNLEPISDADNVEVTPNSEDYETNVPIDDDYDLPIAIERVLRGVHNGLHIIFLFFFLRDCIKKGKKHIRVHKSYTRKNKQKKKGTKKYTLPHPKPNQSMKSTTCEYPPSIYTLTHTKKLLRKIFFSRLYDNSSQSKYLLFLSFQIVYENTRRSSSPSLNTSFIYQITMPP